MFNLTISTIKLVYKQHLRIFQESIIVGPVSFLHVVILSQIPLFNSEGILSKRHEKQPIYYVLRFYTRELSWFRKSGDNKICVR